MARQFQESNCCLRQIWAEMNLGGYETVTVNASSIFAVPHKKITHATTSTILQTGHCGNLSRDLRAKKFRTLKLVAQGFSKCSVKQLTRLHYIFTIHADQLSLSLFCSSVFALSTDARTFIPLHIEKQPKARLEDSRKYWCKLLI